MLDTTDIKKLKKVFVTKNYLKKELSKYATKKDLQQMQEIIIHEITDVVVTLSDSLEKSFAKIGNHEQRLNKLEDKAFA